MKNDQIESKTHLNLKTLRPLLSGATMGNKFKFWFQLQNLLKSSNPRKDPTLDSLASSSHPNKRKKCNETGKLNDIPFADSHCHSNTPRDSKNKHLCNVKDLLNTRFIFRYLRPYTVKNSSTQNATTESLDA